MVSLSTEDIKRHSQAAGQSNAEERAIKKLPLSKLGWLKKIHNLLMWFILIVTDICVWQEMVSSLHSFPICVWPLFAAL